MTYVEEPTVADELPEATFPWKQVAIVLIVTLGLALLAAIIITTASCYIWLRQSRKNKEVISYTPGK